MDEKKNLDKIVEEVNLEAEEAEAKAEEAVAEAEEAIETAEEKAEEALEEAEEALEEAEEALEEATDAAEEAVENAADAAEEAAEEAVEKAEEEAEKAEEAVKKALPKKHSAEPVVIKKKSTFNTPSIIAIIVAAVVVVACVLFVGSKLGWFKGEEPKQTSKYTMDDYSELQVLKSSVEVSDETVQNYINNILSTKATQEQVMEGTIEEGDTIYMSYIGKIAETGEAFEGGSTEGTTITVGSSGYIDGFDAQLVGHQIGETFDINVTFPEDYSPNPDLAGVPAIFTITVDYKRVTHTPELTDEFAKEYSAENFETTTNTVAELKEYVRNYLYKNNLHAGIFSALKEKIHVESYEAEMETQLKAYSEENLQYYAAMYGYDIDTIAQMYGYQTAEEYELDEAHYYMDVAMMFDQVCKDKGITYTDEDIDKALEEYIKNNGYDSTYTVEEFKEQSGETWMFLFTNLEFKYDKVMEALEPNVVLVDELPETESEAETPTDAAN